MSVALSAAALGSVGAFDVAAPVAAPPDLERGQLRDRRESARDESRAIFYIVSSQAEALALEAEIARDWPTLDTYTQFYLHVDAFAAETPENDALIERLTLSDWVVELGHHVTVVDLRASIQP